MLTSKWKKA